MSSRTFILRMRPRPPCNECKIEKWDRVPEGLRCGHLIIGWAKAKGLRNRELTFEEFRDIIRRAYSDCYDTKPGLATRHAKQAWRFIRCMKEGDLVVVPDGKKFHIGRVASAPCYDEEKVACNNAYRRNAEWLRKDLDRAEASAELQKAMRNRSTLPADCDEVARAVRHILR